MIKTRNLIIIVTLICSSLSSIAQIAVKAAEEVKLPSIPFTLHWENSPQSFKVTKEGISITADQKTDIYTFVDGNYYTNNVPKLLFKPDSNFIFSAKVSPAFDSVYDGGAIILYSDSSNWAKLLLEKQDKKTIGLGASVIKNKKTDDSYHPINSNEIYIKVAKADKVFCFYSSTDGKSWKLLRTFAFENPGFRIGFYAQSPKGKSCTVNFKDIKYKGVGFTNFFTGE